MASSNIGIATDTFYPQFGHDEGDTLRGELALRTLTEAMGRDYHLAVVDGGEEDCLFQKAMKGRQIPFAQQEKPGMSAGRQQGYRMLADIGEVTCFVRIEAEKSPFITNGCVEIAAEPILQGKSQIVIPCRTEEGFASLPIFQAGSERAANAALGAVLRKFLRPFGPNEDLDLFFGPRLFNKEALAYFLEEYESNANESSYKWEQSIRPDRYSNALFFPVVDALISQQLKVLSVPVPYVHPPAQTAFEEDHPIFHQKRIEQVSSIIAEMLEFLHLAGEIDTPFERPLIKRS